MSLFQQAVFLTTVAHLRDLPRDAVREVADRLAGSGHRIVDAPISGGPVRAGEGDLLVTVGADDDAWSATQPVLEAMAGTLVRVGAKAGDDVEVNVTFYRLMGPAETRRWPDHVAANPRFAFCAKLWRGFTHDPEPGDLAAVTARFLEGLQ